MHLSERTAATLQLLPALAGLVVRWPASNPGVSGFDGWYTLSSGSPAPCRQPQQSTAPAVILSWACLLQRETVMLKVLNMNNQAKLYSQGFRPVFRVGQGQWQFIRWGAPVPQTACLPANTPVSPSGSGHQQEQVHCGKIQAASIEHEHKHAATEVERSALTVHVPTV